MIWRLILPSLKVSGGVREVLRLTERLSNDGADAALVCMWQSPRSMSTRTHVHYLSRLKPNARWVIAQMPLLLLSFFRLRRALDQSSHAQTRFVFTHFATLPLSMLVPVDRRYYFVQDLEWKFVQPALVSAALRRVILFCYRRGHAVSANRYLTQMLDSYGIRVWQELPIWADAAFGADPGKERDIDFAMVLRKGAHKRLDLYRAYIDEARKHGRLRLAVITPEDEIADSVRDLVAEVVCRPSLEGMRDLYARSKCFVHLSEHEGFGLPPLEAMGAGCVPLCRDSGGVRTFMIPELADLVVPLSMSIDEVFTRAVDLISDEGRLAERERTARYVFLRGFQVASTRAPAPSSI